MTQAANEPMNEPMSEPVLSEDELDRIVPLGDPETDAPVS